MGNRGTLIVISGFSGVGKGTVVKGWLLIMDMNYPYQRLQGVLVPEKNTAENTFLSVKMNLRI